MSTMNICAQSWGTPYFTESEMPDMRNFLPGPPEENSARFAYDKAQYQWGKEQRNNPTRREITIRDAEYSLDRIIKEFSEPFGLQISKNGTPEIYNLLYRALPTCDKICTDVKKFYKRVRPFRYYNEQTLIPSAESSHGDDSYPSGHTILGWSAALLLTEVNPYAADTLMARGYMFGDSRIIAGYHWQSDIDAARLAASVAFAKLHTSAEFVEQMEKARNEFLQKRCYRVAVANITETTEIGEIECTAPEQKAKGNGRIYTINGAPAKNDTRGVVIEDGHKVVKK